MMKSLNKTQQYSKSNAICWVIVAYIASITCALLYLCLELFQPLRTESILLNTFIADTIATMVIFIFSRVFSNSSFYDAYWSVIPPLILHYWIMVLGVNMISLPVILIGLVIWCWAIRLTWKWAKHWSGIHHEDWRYGLLKEKAPQVEFFTDFFAIHFFPTCQVFLGMLPVYIFLQNIDSVNALVYLACIVGLAAWIIQLIADKQLHEFITNKQTGDIIQHGLWAYSRHPNYFGELLFWLSLSLFGLSADTSHSLNLVGFIAMLIMFLSASIPMMEKRSLERRPHYQKIIQTTSMLLPMPKRKP